MGKIKPVWLVPVTVLFFLGLVALLPLGNFKSPFFNYRSLLPLAPIPSLVLWLVAYIVYRVGCWLTQKPIKKP